MVKLHVSFKKRKCPAKKPLSLNYHKVLRLLTFKVEMASVILREGGMDVTRKSKSALVTWSGGSSRDGVQIRGYCGEWKMVNKHDIIRVSCSRT